MALPRGWDETTGEWRVRLRAPGRFVRIRPKPLEGVNGVYMVGGPLKRGDREHGRHRGGAFVPQALRFKKADWPSLTAAVGWFQASRFAGGELDNPSKGSLPQIEREYNEGYNPPRRGELRLGAFRAGVDEAIEKLVRTETELTALMAQALELVDRGAPVPQWIRERGRGLELERRAELEAVRTAVARHAAVIGELSPAPAKRRANPSSDRRAATELYRSFHGGAAPSSFHFEQIPDLSQLVHMGTALRVDYQAARPRGSRNTPYRHEFAGGSKLFTDRSGRALVILGNVKVSRAPRGRFGYIRAGAR